MAPAVALVPTHLLLPSNDSEPVPTSSPSPQRGRLSIMHRVVLDWIYASFGSVQILNSPWTISVHFLSGLFKLYLKYCTKVSITVTLELRLKYGLELLLKQVYAPM